MGGEDRTHVELAHGGFDLGEFEAPFAQRGFDERGDARERTLVGVAALAAAMQIGLDSPELAGEELRRAARCLERVAGRISVEDVLDEIFSSLCVGK